MFDLKTRKRDFEQQLFFLLEKSQTSGTKSKFQEIERRKVARPRDRRAQKVMWRFLSSAIVPTTPSERSQTRDICFFIIIARRRETEEHPPSSFSLSKRDRYKNEKKRKEVCELRKKREVYVFRDRSADAVGTISVNERKALFSSSSLDFENAPSFHAALPREKRKTRHTRREKKRLAHLKTPRPF